MWAIINNGLGLWIVTGPRAIMLDCYLQRFPSVVVQQVEPENCDGNDGCKGDVSRTQQLSAESNLIEIARHSNPVVVVKKLDKQR